VLNYVYAVSINRLVQQKLVVDLRGEVYDKLQRLSFRFFDANTTGSIITRVTATCRRCACSSTRCSSRASSW
jgi:ATP-binding cassette subfamily B protein